MILALSLALAVAWQDAEADRRRQQQQEDRARQQIDQARMTVARIEGRVELLGGDAPPDRVTVTLVCGGQVANKQLTDSRGGFVLSLSTPAAAGRDANGSPMATSGQTCLVEAALMGYHPAAVEVDTAGMQGSIGVARRVRIQLRPSGDGGLTYSATTLAASEDARKAYDRGLRENQKKNFAEAESRLRRAVELHARFASAWYELGRVYVAAGRPADARLALQKAVESDGRYFNPYPLLIQLDLAERRWEDLARNAQTAISLAPAYSAEIYLFSAQANLKLGQLEIAEKHGREAVSLKNTPVARRLLAAILAGQGKNKEAATELRALLEAFPTFPDVAQVKEEIQRLER